MVSIALDVATLMRLHCSRVGLLSRQPHFLLMAHTQQARLPVGNSCSVLSCQMIYSQNVSALYKAFAITEMSTAKSFLKESAIIII